MDNDNGQRVFTTSMPGGRRESFRAGEVAVLSLDFENELIPGWRYHVTLDLEAGPAPGSSTAASASARWSLPALAGARGSRRSSTTMTFEHERTTVADVSSSTATAPARRPISGPRAVGDDPRRALTCPWRSR